MNLFKIKPQLLFLCCLLSHATWGQNTAQTQEFSISSTLLNGLVLQYFNGTLFQISHTNKGQSLTLPSTPTGQSGVPLALSNAVQSYCSTTGNAATCFDEFMSKMYRNLPKDAQGRVLYRSFIQWGPELKRIDPNLKDQLLYVPIVAKNMPTLGVRHITVNGLNSLMNSSNFALSLKSNQLIIDIKFKSDQPTLIWGGGAPDFNFNNARASITFNGLNTNAQGKLTYTSAEAVFNADVDNYGIYRVIIEPFVEGPVKRNISNQIRQALNSPTVKNTILLAIQKSIEKHVNRPNLRISALKVENGNLKITYVRP